MQGREGEKRENTTSTKQETKNQVLQGGERKEKKWDDVMIEGKRGGPSEIFTTRHKTTKSDNENATHRGRQGERARAS